MAATAVMQGLLAERLRAERVISTGTVRWFDPQGCGVISPDEGDDELFFRSRFVTLAAGARVEFEVDEGPAGLQAYNVARIPPPDAHPSAPPPRAAARHRPAPLRRY